MDKVSPDPHAHQPRHALDDAADRLEDFDQQLLAAHRVDDLDAVAQLLTWRAAAWRAWAVAVGADSPYYRGALLRAELDDTNAARLARTPAVASVDAGQHGAAPVGNPCSPGLSTGDGPCSPSGAEVTATPPAGPEVPAAGDAVDPTGGWALAHRYAVVTGDLRYENTFTDSR